MPCRSSHRRRLTCAAVVVGFCLSAATLTRGENRSEQPGTNRISTTANTAHPDAGTAAGTLDGYDGKRVSLEHALDFARRAYDQINQEVMDYTCVMISRQRVDGNLSGYRTIYAKVRHERKHDDGTVTPFSVYLRFLKPASVVGREVLYVPSWYEGDLIARLGGRKFPNTTLQLRPESAKVLSGNRYPINEVGMQTLNRRVIELLELEQEHEDALIELFSNAKVDGRPSTFFRLTYQKRRPGTTCRMAEIAFDNEMSIPIYYRAVDWPTAAEAEPVMEEYCYKRVQVNVGLTDHDFDVRNPEYRFNLIEPGTVAAGDSRADELP
ncbi:MAG: DUF1571 domain-containing protein [Pirellulaceae bacterium]